MRHIEPPKEDFISLSHTTSDGTILFVDTKLSLHPGKLRKEVYEIVKLELARLIQREKVRCLKKE